MSINRVVISGNLTRDSEIRATQSGLNILTFGMAVNDRRRNSQTGEWEDSANFVDCVLFGNRAEFLSRVLRKGTKVVVEGKLRYSSWERDGQRRSKLEVVVDDVDFLSQRQQGMQQYDSGQGQRRYGQQDQQQGFSASVPTSYSTAQPVQATQPAQAPVNPAPVGQPPASSPANNQVPQQNQGYTPTQAPPSSDVYDEDIPF